MWQKLTSFRNRMGKVYVLSHGPRHQKLTWVRIAKECFFMVMRLDLILERDIGFYLYSLGENTEKPFFPRKEDIL